jgi:hypothetical protein
VNERSFSTHPRNRAPLTIEQRTALERREAEMTEKLEQALEQHSAEVALIGRIGSDLSPLRFENERPRVTHVGLALREPSGWQVHHLMNTHEGPDGDLYRQPLVDFFRDDPFEYRASVLVPSLDLQRRIDRTLQSARRQALHTRRYSRVSFPFSTRYQNSNQWVLEIVAAAQSGEGTRGAVQAYLAKRGLAPSVLRAVGLLKQTMGRLVSRNTRFDDHPLRERLRGRIAFMLGSSLHRYVRGTDDVLGEVEIALGLPLGIADHGGTHAQSS